MVITCNGYGHHPCLMVVCHDRIEGSIYMARPGLGESVTCNGYSHRPCLMRGIHANGGNGSLQRRAFDHQKQFVGSQRGMNQCVGSR